MKNGNRRIVCSSCKKCFPIRSQNLSIFKTIKEEKYYRCKDCINFKMNKYIYID